MKTRNLFLSLFAFAALCACNKEAQPEVPQILDADTYIKVNIMATDASTRAYEYGETNENDVNNALFIFFNGPDVLPEANYTFNWDKKDSGNNVAKSATVRFKANSEKPTSMIVLLNYDTSVDYANMDKATLRKHISENYAVEIGGTPYFTMTNSVYAEGVNEVCEVALNDANFKKVGAENEVGDAITPVDVYVERVAAKVKFIDNIVVTPTADALAVSITPEVVGYNVVNTPDRSYDFKKINTAWDYSSVENGASDWSKPGDFRSFWAQMPTSDDLTTAGMTMSYSEIAYEDINTRPDYVYVHENTAAGSDATKVILAAVLKADLDGDSVKEPVDLVRYNDTYYTLDGFKTLAIEQVQSLDALTITEAMLEPVSGSAAGITNGYEMVLQLNNNYTTSGGTKADEINTALKTMSALYWNQGSCYYYTEIKHDLYDEDKLLSGVVRNHVYSINLKGVKGLGVPVADPEEPIDPETPSDEFYSLNATINILQWKVVGQDVVFGE